MANEDDYDRAIASIDACNGLLNSLMTLVGDDTAAIGWVGPAREDFDRSVGESHQSIRRLVQQLATARSTALARAIACRAYRSEVENYRWASAIGATVDPPVCPWFCDPIPVDAPNNSTHDMVEGPHRGS